MKRYALLDTDFISKTHSVQDDGGNHLIDLAKQSESIEQQSGEIAERGMPT